MIVELSVDHLAGGAGNGAGALGVEQAEFAIALCGGKFDDAERPDDRLRHALLADPEVVAGAFGLRAPVAVGGDLDRPERVGFCASSVWLRCACHQIPSIK